MSDKRSVDRENLSNALALIRVHVPGAVSVDLATSDQGTYGFVLTDVNMSDGTKLLQAPDHNQLDAVLDQASDLLCDIDWNGVVEEDIYGYATVSL